MPKKPNPYNEECGKRLEQVRRALGFEKNRHAAEAWEVHEDTYESWEKGKNAIPPLFVLRLRQEHGITHDWIYAGDPSRLPLDIADRMKLISISSERYSKQRKGA